MHPAWCDCFVTVFWSHVYSSKLNFNQIIIILCLSYVWITWWGWSSDIVYIKENAVSLFSEVPLRENWWVVWWLTSIYSASFSELTLCLFPLQSCASGSGAQWLPVLLFAVLRDITTLFISRLHITSLNWPVPLHSIKVQLYEDFAFLKKIHYIPLLFISVWLILRLSDLPGFAAHLRLSVCP